MKLKNLKIHIIGIGGISMSAIARLLLHYNNTITGSDIHESNITRELEKLGVKIYYGHSRENILQYDLVIKSAAISDDNIEIIEAKNRCIKVISRAEALGIITNDYNNVIAVSGSHGKTTTTGMIAECFLNAGYNPTIHIGGELISIKGNIYIGSNDYFITEACEYMDSFLHLTQDCAIALNIQPDHMDYFKNFGNLQKSFEKYIKNTKQNGLIVLNGDDETLKNIVSAKQKTIYYSTKNPNANIYAKNIRKNIHNNYSFDIIYNGYKYERIKLSIPGLHEVYNALACISVCLHYSIDIKVIKKSLENYSGIKRRFEYVGRINGAKVIHDYAHHPTEIRAVIDTVKNKKGRVIVVFQPHTYSRTKELWLDFIDALALGDVVYLYKIYPARENSIRGVTSKKLSEEINKINNNSYYYEDFNLLHSRLKEVAREDDVILVLGAGDIVEFCEKIQMNI